MIFVPTVRKLQNKKTNIKIKIKNEILITKNAVQLFSV